ncbi:MAG: hypothetical protein EKK55_07890 [Rhodocyclaceae bacterium]|nr:MAG: hypothetical protein EKK55_07890 [Rhodocyclaceae bacterium]
MDLSKFDGHTSGPWVSQDASQPDCLFFYVRVAATGEWIVMVCDTEKRGHKSTEANAALIAAAPDLLAEVRRLRKRDDDVKRIAKSVQKHVEQDRKGYADLLGDAIKTRAATGRTPSELAALVERMRGIIADWNCWEDDPRGAAFALRNALLAELDAKPKEG